MISEKKADKSVDQQIRMEPRKGTLPVENIKIAAAQIIDSIPEIKIKATEGNVTGEQIAAPVAVLAKGKTSSVFRTKGRVLSSEDNMPVPGASILINTAILFSEERFISKFIKP